MGKISLIVKIIAPALGLLIAIFFCVLLTYNHTKESYRAVGLSDGKIELASNIISKIESISKIDSCGQLDANWKKVELFVAKPDVIYLISDTNGITYCCRS